MRMETEMALATILGGTVNLAMRFFMVAGVVFVACWFFVVSAKIAFWLLATVFGYYLIQWFLFLNRVRIVYQFTTKL